MPILTLKHGNGFTSAFQISYIEGRKRKGQWKMRWLDGMDSTDMRLSKLQEIMKGKEAWSVCGHKESDMTERLHFHCSLSCIGEGNGNPLQCSCLENPRDGGAW